MKSLVSLAALSLMLAGNQVSAAPAPQASAAPATNATISAQLEGAAPPVASVVAELSATSPIDVDTAEDVEVAAKGGSAKDLRKMTRKYKRHIIKTLLKRKKSDKGCTLSKLSVRKEW
jgi:hypothetical protein